MITSLIRLFSLLAGAVLLHACTEEAAAPTAGEITISVIGTNDVHGQILDVNGNRGLPLFSGYVDNLRDVRAGDGGSVVLIDAGDMWQGTLESNLTEGAFMIEAYNALGYAAVTIGNHEFDFGPAGEKAIPVDPADDPHGALKERATEADFPLLTANIIDIGTGDPVSWPNVIPSTMLDIDGVKIGVIGLLSLGGLQATMAANTETLVMAPLAAAVGREATALRTQGAEIVIVTAHAGSRCESFDDPHDLSVCDTDDEIMRLARELPAGLVDQIVAGHVHAGIAHEVNGIAIIASFSNARAFGRVDYTFDLGSREITARQIHPPHPICGHVSATQFGCVAADAEGASVATYEGSPVVPSAAVLAIADKATAYVSEVKSQELGVLLETPFTRRLGTRSALGHLFMDAIYESTDGDVVIHNVMGGLRADLPAGELTYGSAYELYPFDNRMVELALSGAELRKIIRAQTLLPGRRAGFAGMRVFADCDTGNLNITMIRPDGSEITDDEALTVVTTDFLAMAGDNVFTPVAPEGGFDTRADGPLARDLFVDWMRARGGSITTEQFLDTDNPRWNIADTVPDQCNLQAPAAANDRDN